MTATENQIDDSLKKSTADRLLAAIERIWPSSSWGSGPIVVAVSGGADSVALLELLRKTIIRQNLANRLVVAHVNHGLRGLASDSDAEFVAELAKNHDLALEQYSQSPSITSTSEESLRDIRTEFFAKVAAKHAARYVATAHHADDQVETFVFRLLRGTSISGASGIPLVRELREDVTLVRPLLGCWRAELRHFLVSIGQSFREDASNDSLDYSRNRIRNELLPMLERNFGPGVSERLLSFVEQTVPIVGFLRLQARDAFSTTIRICSPTEVEVFVNPFARLPEVIQCQLIVELWDEQGWPRGDLGQLDIQQVRECLLAENSLRVRHQFPPAIAIRGTGETKQIVRLTIS
ncbi:MAG: tRNA lysidine(34) synthetase TilS [Pirellulaceae bacterium]